MIVFGHHHRLPAAADGVNQLRMLETALAVGYLLVASGTFRMLLLANGDDRDAGSLLFQLITLALYCSAALILVLKGVPHWFSRLLIASWPILALTGMAFLSTVWSDAPATTFRRAAALVLTTGFAFYVVATFDMHSFTRILAAAFVLFFVVAIGSAAIPGLGITPAGIHEGAWRGLTGQKNEFGRTCGLALTYFMVVATVAGPGMRKGLILAASMAVILLLLSTSKTPITATVVGFGGTLINLVLLHGRVGRLRLAGEVRLVLFLAIATIIPLVVFWLVPAIVEAMGRDLTFSGRTELWKWAIGIGADTPWFGSGYRGFWNDGNTQYFFEYFAWGRTLDGELSDSYTGPTHSHSGYVDLWLELGWVGTVLYAGVICSAFARIAYCFRARRFDVALCLSAVTWFLLAYAFTAKSIMQQSEDLWFLFLVFYLYAVRTQVEDEGPMRAPREDRPGSEPARAPQPHSLRDRPWA
jgi:exopolysaccharide production protein ExoQ